MTISTNLEPSLSGYKSNLQDKGVWFMKKDQEDLFEEENSPDKDDQKEADKTLVLNAIMQNAFVVKDVNSSAR